jgi:hypothetical protein
MDEWKGFPNKLKLRVTKYSQNNGMHKVKKICPVEI